jgi:hypothetical protein
MIVGEHSRDIDLDVNVVREKKMTNMRAFTSDEAIRLVPHTVLNVGQAIDFIADDEFVEVNPKVSSPAQKDPPGQPPSEALGAGGRLIPSSVSSEEPSPQFRRPSQRDFHPIHVNRMNIRLLSQLAPHLSV